jgi:hypothetical protein
LVKCKPKELTKNIVILYLPQTNKKMFIKKKLFKKTNKKKYIKINNKTKQKNYECTSYVLLNVKSVYIYSMKYYETDKFADFG